MNVRRARTALTLAQAGAGAVVAARLARGRTRLPPLDPHAPRPAGSVSVLIPARNEAARLGACLDGLLGGGTVGDGAVGDAAVAANAISEIIVIDDQSTDATAAVAAARGVRVLDGAPPLPGWVGKPWALQQGLLAARGPWIVTLDADTRPTPGLVAGLVDAARRHEYRLLTVGGRYECGSVAEQALHASMVASLVYRFGPPGTGPAKVGRTLANGQCTVFDKDDLLGAGGFAAAAGHFSDDVALARHLAGQGWRVGLLDGPGLLSVDMHDGVRSVWREWGRTLALGDVTPTPVAVADLLTWTLTAALPGLRLLAARPARVDLGLLAMRVALAAGLRGAYARPVRGVLLSPLADAAVAVRLALSIARPPRRWREREYVVSRSGVAGAEAPHPDRTSAR